MKTTYVLQVPINVTSYEEIIAEIQKKIKQKQKYSIISINLNKIILANEKSEMMPVIQSFDCFIPDGISVVRANKELKERITGVDLFQKICEEHEKIGAKIFLYGAQEEIVEAAKANLEEKYKNIQIVGFENGFVKDNEALIQKINDSKANIVFIAMGSPRQEKWIYNHRNELKVDVATGQGGTYDYEAGKIKRAPKIFQKLCIEWLWRLILQPSRIIRMLALPVYLFKITFTKDITKGKFD